MTPMNTATPTEMLPPPANGNGTGTVPAEVVQAAAAAVDTELAKKLKAIEDLGRQIAKKNRERDKQATVVAEAKSELDGKRDVLNKIEHTLEELHDELATLAVGKNSERLPFGEAKAEKVDAGNRSAQTVEQELQDAFDALSLSAIGVKPALIGKLEADGIRDGKGLRTWIQSHPRRDIKGIGKGYVDQLANLLTDKMLEMHEAAKKVAGPTVDSPEEIVSIADHSSKHDTAPLLNVKVWVGADGKWSWSYKVGYGADAGYDQGIGAASRDDAARVALVKVIKIVSYRKQTEKGEALQQADAVQAAAQAALDKLNAPFDDATIKQETAERVLNVQNVAFIEIAHRAGGQWAMRYRAVFGKKHGVKSSPHEDDWIGNNPSRVHAVSHACDRIYGLIRETRGVLSGKAKKQASEVTRAIDQLDKKLAEDVKADTVADDVKEFWAARPAREAEEAPKAKKGRAK